MNIYELLANNYGPTRSVDLPDERRQVLEALAKKLLSAESQGISEKFVIAGIKL